VKLNAFLYALQYFNFDHIAETEHCSTSTQHPDSNNAGAMWKT
jgi:hypothetical protein